VYQLRAAHRIDDGPARSLFPFDPDPGWKPLARRHIAAHGAECEFRREARFAKLMEKRRDTEHYARPIEFYRRGN
jgi:hypothetical protein